MALPTLADFKRHQRIRHSQEDDDLQMKLDAAIDAASEFLNRPIPWLAAEQSDPSNPVYAPVPNSVRGAILIMAAELYVNREQSVTGTIYTRIPTATDMLWPFRASMGV